jgi:pimeloyl-ACP methyl ester carboxylesterase
MKASLNHTTIKSADGVALAVQQGGKPAGRDILFIHGFNQCYLSWSRQLGDPVLADRFRLTTFDLRGHGASAKPAEGQAYLEDRRWADDVATVIRSAGLRNPVLVGWSYGGRIISDYLRHHGTSGIAGINYVGARVSNNAALFGPGRMHMAGMTSEDLAANITGTRGFLRACFEIQPDEADFETMLAFNMVVPAALRAHMLARAPDDGAVLKTIACSVLVTHGQRDQIILPAMAAFCSTSVSGSKVSLYDGVGHSPFWEDAPRFNHELAEFVAGLG